MAHFSQVQDLVTISCAGLEGAGGEEGGGGGRRGQERELRVGADKTIIRSGSFLNRFRAAKFIQGMFSYLFEAWLLFGLIDILDN